MSAQLLLRRGVISIHAARVGCDGFGTIALEKPCQFQSTQPEWAATKNGVYANYGGI